MSGTWEVHEGDHSCQQGVTTVPLLRATRLACVRPVIYLRQAINFRNGLEGDYD